ncbi:tyrosine-type recombinase/integrase [Tengunoibacter tsumagoiensis]|uniref:Tyrosine recombinase XerC n=1 Tax=Tengunoibacter tsumagoiensis TaxID=2014871 RepID=A0A402A2V1_9CHLR|nr:tyrosine-type recombinase/integrase [Tengunoibacter tsumagoiensis]GCE13473.1 tyrosine recombinase XerC [Tengunoibacter tsumagoiensis]
MLQEAVEEYLKTLLTRGYARKRNSQNTILAYSNDLGQLCTYLEEQKVEAWSRVTSELMRAYLQEMHETLEYRSTTIARKLAVFKSFFRYLHALGAIVYDPVEKLEIPFKTKATVAILNIEQIRHLFAQIATDLPGGLRDLAMLHVLYATGMRSSELVELRVDDFDGQGRSIRCPARGRQGKRFDRIFPLSKAAIEAIERYLEQGRPRLLRYSCETALFLNHHGAHLTRQGFWLIIKGHARRAGIVGLTPHILRNSLAVLLLNEGPEPRSLEELLGYADLSTRKTGSSPQRKDEPDPSI